jgi:hypothetical protein
MTADYRPPLAVRLSTHANFSDGSNALVTAAINLGFTAAEVANLRTILQGRGFTVTA